MHLFGFRSVVVYLDLVQVDSRAAVIRYADFNKDCRKGMRNGHQYCGSREGCDL